MFLHRHANYLQRPAFNCDTMSSVFKAPFLNLQIKRDAHSNVPRCIPAMTADYSEVREFIYQVLTLRSHGTCIEHPDIVRETVNHWVGNGRVFFAKVECDRFSYLDPLKDVVRSGVSNYQAKEIVRGPFSLEVRNIYGMGGQAADGARFDDPKESDGPMHSFSGSARKKVDDSKRQTCSAVVLHDYKPRGVDELKLRAGEQLSILEKKDDHWWFGIDNLGNRGLVTSSNIKFLGNERDGRKQGRLSGLWRWKKDNKKGECNNEEKAEESGAFDFDRPGQGSTPPPYTL